MRGVVAVLDGQAAVEAGVSLLVGCERAGEGGDAGGRGWVSVGGGGGGMARARRFVAGLVWGCVRGETGHAPAGEAVEEGVGWWGGGGGRDQAEGGGAPGAVGFVAFTACLACCEEGFLGFGAVGVEGEMELGGHGGGDCWVL